MAVIIEFAGIPCSGKSTAYERSYECFRAKGFVKGDEFFRRYVSEVPVLGALSTSRVMQPFVRIVVLAWTHILQAFGTPGLYWRLTREIMRSELKGKTARSVFFKLGKGLIIRRKSSCSVYVDEGIIQMLFAIFTTTHDCQEHVARIGSLLSYLPVPDVVIFGPDKPEEEFVRRLLTRGHHRVTGNRHTKTRLKRPLVGNALAERRAIQIVHKSAKIQRALVQELEGLAIVKYFSDIDASCLKDAFR